MIDDTLLEEYGLLGSFDTIVNMSGEQVAVKLHPVDEMDENESEDDALSSISFIELQDNSTLLSNQLKMRFGVKSGDYVLIVTNGNTGAELIAMLSAMRLEATFIPLSIPIELDSKSERRLQSIISMVAPSAAIFVAADDNDSLVHNLAKLGVYKCALLTSRGILSADDPSAAVMVTPLSSSGSHHNDSPLYLLFTSGSTGEPKGVRGTYRGLINRIAWQYRNYPYEFGEVALRRTPLTFVDSLAEIFAPLLAGIPIVDYLMGPIQTNGLASVIEEVSFSEVSRVTLIPSQLLLTCRLLHSTITTTDTIWPSLRYVIVSGEECPASLVKLFRVVFPRARLLNLYGSTEVAGDVTAALLYDGHADSTDETMDDVDIVQAAIGSAIDGNFLFLVQHKQLDDSALRTLQLVTDRTLPGELLVIGEHVALGYLQHSNSSNETNNTNPFIANPFVTNQFLLPAEYDTTQKEMIFSYSTAFLTGDIVQWSSFDPLSLIWLGRRDRVIKVRGNKVSLEEVERSANAILGVDQVVVVFSLPQNDKTDQKLLVMIVDYAHQLQQHYLQQQEQQSAGDIRQQLIVQLPELQRPHIVLFIDEGFPRTSSMKIDRVALKQQVLTLLEEQQTLQPILVDTTTDSVTGTDAAIEDIFAEIRSYLQDILPQPQALSSMDTNKLRQVDFFTLGGDSISAIELLWRLRQSHPSATLQQHTLRLSLLQLATYIACPSSNYKHSSRTEEVNEQDKPASKKSKRDQPSVVTQLQILPGAFTSIAKRGEYVFNHSTIATNNQTSLKLLWRYPLLKCIDASPVLCWGPERSLTIIGCHGGRVAAIDNSTGNMVWEVDIMEHIEAAVTVDLEHGLVFVVSYLGNDVDGFVATADTVNDGDEVQGSLGAIRCLSLYTGAEVWMQRLKGECKASPVILSSLSALLVADYAGYLYMLNVADGHRIRQVEGIIPGSVFASPVVFDQERRAIICTTRGWIVMVRLQDLVAECHESTESTIFVTPCIFSDELNSSFSCVVAFTDGSIRSYQWRPQIGALLNIWKSDVSAAPFFSSPALVQNRNEKMRMAIGCHDGFLRCIDTQSGVVLSAINIGTVIFGTPFIFQSSEHDLVVIATTAGDVIIVNIDQEQVLHKFHLPAEVFSSPVIDEQGRLLIGCRDDHVYCLQLTSTTEEKH